VVRCWQPLLQHSNVNALDDVRLCFILTAFQAV
jgi:hypothetical protein